MTPKQIVELWIEKFNNADIEGLIEIYAVDEINHQVVTKPLKDREEIRKLFEVDFARAKMVCIPEMIHEAGEWAILEWRDPLGLRGCGFFHIQNNQIVFQRGYFDQLSFFKQQGLPIPKEYLEG
jgi:limonene-1,2-epoxide hydrolase